MIADTAKIRADLKLFSQGRSPTIGYQDVLDALFELDRFREVVGAYLENDSQHNWDRLAALMEPNA